MDGLEDYVRQENAKSNKLLAGLLGITMSIVGCNQLLADDCYAASKVYATVKNKAYAKLSGSVTAKIGDTTVELQSQGAFHGCAIRPIDEDYVMKHNYLFIKVPGQQERVIEYNGWFPKSIEISAKGGTVTEQDTKGRVWEREFLYDGTIYQSRQR